MKNENNKSMRLNFYMKQALVDAIDDYADYLGITRSAAISVLCANQLQALNTMNNVGGIKESLDRAYLLLKENDG